jgi:type VI secretion system protein ImpH
MADLISKLINEGCSFDFFQAVSILQNLLFNENKQDPIASGKIRFEPDPSISFPVSDISSIYRKDESIHFLLSFMSLTGISSPLPVYFSQYISECSDKSSGLADFIKIFNHRIYTLFYNALERSGITGIINDKSKLFKAILSLTGINSASQSDDASLHIAYCSNFVGKSGSRAGLISILSDYFGKIPVSIVEFVPRWVKVNSILTVGNGIILGQNAILGSCFFDRSAKFRIVLGPLPCMVYETFLPGKANLNKLIEIVDCYMSDALEYDIEIQFETSDLMGVVLGEPDASLGVTALLGKADKEKICSILLEIV